MANGKGRFGAVIGGTKPAATAEAPSGMGQIGGASPATPVPSGIPSFYLGGQQFVVPGGQAGGMRVQAAAERQRELSMNLRQEYNQRQIVKDSQAMQAQVGRMVSVWNHYVSNPDDIKSKNALDQSLVITFNKMLDPGSVVRESEFARTPQGESLVEKYRGKLEAITKGGVGLTDAGRQELVNTAYLLLQGQMQFLDEEQAYYTDLAKYIGADPKWVVRKSKVKIGKPLVIKVEDPIIRELRAKGASEKEIAAVKAELEGGKK